MLGFFAKALATFKLFWLNIRLLFARGFSRSKALVQLGAKCYEERRLATEESGLYAVLDAQALHEANLRSALDAEMVPSVGWWDKVKQIGGRWAKRADLARSGALRMKLHRDLGERFFQSEASAQPRDPAVATVLAEQQRIQALESKAEELRVHVPKVLAHPAVAGVAALALLALAGSVIPQGAATAILPMALPFGAKSSGHKLAESTKERLSQPSAPASAGLRRGPKIHGFQLGMTLDEFRANLRQVAPEFTEEEVFQDASHVLAPDSIDDPVFDSLLSSGAEAFGVSYTSEKGGFPAAIVSVIGDEQAIISIKFETPLLLKMFNLKNLNFREFCQEFINNYDIPGLEPTPDRFMPSLNNLRYYSRKEGYSIVFSPSFAVDLGIVPMETKDRGFGR